MRLLLDTHLLVWACLEDNKLSSEARRLILDDSNEIHYSAMAMLEVAIKHEKYPDRMAISAPDLMEYAAECGFYDTPLEERHTFLLDTLQRPDGAPPHHDPFDRVMICQAKAEGMLFLTHDAMLPYYQEPCVYYV
ncbi:MAG: type II toxin-antitoxin system VapC family toxin [Eggerthellaceae bacterium]|nr:type II toxin-antitoxin system VapC family toxin [Eggerthellaceae bacterium]